MFETKPISCLTEARKCQCSILFLLNLHEVCFCSSVHSSLMFPDWRLGGGNHLIIPPDDFVTIIQVMGFVLQRSGQGWANMSTYLHILRSLARSTFQQNDIALNEINIFDQWNIFASLNLTQSLWSVTVVEIVQVKWSILIEFTLSTASVLNILCCEKLNSSSWQHAHLTTIVSEVSSGFMRL